MKVELTMYTPEIEISNSAKVCYGNNSSKDITSSLVHQHKHLAVLRFAYATVHISGISIACHTQIVRSKHLDFLVQSKRYVSNKKGNFKFIMPKRLTTNQQKCMKIHWDNSISIYNKLITDGVKPEDARAVLPVNTSTEMYVTGSLQGWMSFFKLRLDSHAQTEVREVAVEVYKQLQQVFPQVFIDKLFEKLYDQ